MNKTPGCMDDYDPASLSVAQAMQRINHAVVPLTDSTKLTLLDALGRVLARDIRSPLNVPAHANSAMDGYAINSADLPVSGESALRITGTAWAGKPFEQAILRGECARIMTGALVPAGADTIIMQEHVIRNECSGEVIVIGNGHRVGQHIRHPGEDLRQGEVVMSAGKLLRPADLGVLASLGIADISVLRRVRAAIFTTGDELRTVGERLSSGQIYDSNRYTLHGMLHRLGVDIIDLGIIKDSRTDIARAFNEAAQQADVIISCGGVSVGDADFVKEILTQLGEVDFWKIAMKPGRPLAFGQVHNSLFFGLPGNPVSVMATFYQFVQPALLNLMGALVAPQVLMKIVCANRLKKLRGRVEFQRGIIELNADGTSTVRNTGEQGSGILSSMSKANCFIVLPSECGDVEAGTLVDVQLFEGLV